MALLINIADSRERYASGRLGGARAAIPAAKHADDAFHLVKSGSRDQAGDRWPESGAKPEIEFELRDLSMLDLDKIERVLKCGDLLDLDDEQLSAELETFFQTLEERDRQISETLEALMAEVEELIALSDELESEDEICR